MSLLECAPSKEAPLGTQGTCIYGQTCETDPGNANKAICTAHKVTEIYGQISCLGPLIEKHDGRIRPTFE